MHKLFFTGRVAAAPVLSNHGDSKVTKFTLISNEYTGRDEGSGEAKERQVRIRFTAFGSRGEAIAKNVLKGDQLIVEAKLSNNDFTDAERVNAVATTGCLHSVSKRQVLCGFGIPSFWVG